MAPMMRSGDRSAAISRRKWQSRAMVAGALLVVVACVVGCSGRGSIEVPIRGGESWKLEWEVYPNPDLRGTRACGAEVINGRLYRVLCDGSGRPVYAHDPNGKRWFRLTPSDDAPGWPVSDDPSFVQAGITYVFPPAPKVLTLEVPEDLTAAEVAQAWGANVSDDGVVEAAFNWALDPRSDVLDVTFCADWSLGLPNPWAFDLAYELSLIADETGGVMLHRVVGSRAQVLAYLEGLGGVLTDLTLDGYGALPAAAAWLPRSVLHQVQPLR